MLKKIIKIFDILFLGESKIPKTKNSLTSAIEYKKLLRQSTYKLIISSIKTKKYIFLKLPHIEEKDIYYPNMTTKYLSLIQE
jgi:hypothetical protein